MSTEEKVTQLTTAVLNVITGSGGTVEEWVVV